MPPLKGQSNEIFDLQFFHNSSLPVPIYDFDFAELFEYKVKKWQIFLAYNFFLEMQNVAL